MSLSLLLPLAAEGRFPRWLLDLLSVDADRIGGGTEHFRFARFPEGGLGLLAILALLAGFALIVWNYYREGQLARSRKLLLAAIRCLVLLVAALILFYPVLEVDRKQEVRATTILLVDSSLSQDIRDRYLGDAGRRDATALALGMTPEEVVGATRAELVRRALSIPSIDLLRRLESANPLKAYAFSAPPLLPLRMEEARLPGGQDGEPSRALGPPGEGAPPPPERSPPLDLSQFEATGSVTDIAGSILAALQEEAGARIAGIVLVSDGRVTAGEQLKGIAGLLADRSIPVHAVGVGDPTPTRNFRVMSILAGERVFTGDPVAVDVRVDQHGFDGETVRVELLDAHEPPGESPRAPVLVGAVDVTFPAGRAEATASFRFEPPGVGRHGLTARIEAHPEETFSDDNERSATVEVLQEASKVLLISGGPTYEYRFLKNLLRRDSRVQLAAWLQSADADYPQEGNVSLQKLPAAAKELFEYDVIILMDPDPRGLPADLPEMLERFVGRHRGGLAYLAGDKFATSFFEAQGLAPIRNMLPVVVDPGMLSDEIERGRFYEREWPLEPTPAAMDHAATRLSSQVDRNREVWAEIAGFFWSLPSRKAKPGATVLFVHPDPSLARDGEARPLVATQFYEGGRVAFSGIASTWRWRATAEEVYDRFWIQLMRFLTEGRLLGDRRRILQTDRESYELGETVRISVLLEDENYRPVDAEDVSVTVGGPDGESFPLVLQKDPNSLGWFRGVYAPRVLGTHEFRLEGGSPRAISVEPPALEFAVPRLDEEALGEIATLTRGTYRPLAEISSLPDDIPDRRQIVVATDEPIPLWDNWLSLGLLVGLLTIEWILRKVHRLL